VTVTHFPLMGGGGWVGEGGDGFERQRDTTAKSKTDIGRE
jgi:hypothetical protein